MKALASGLSIFTLIILEMNGQPAEPPSNENFKPLFNDKNLDGWVLVNTHPGTFFVKENEIITTGKPTGFLRTDKQYENFILEMDWMHVNKTEVGNSGLFVWGDPLPAVGTGYTRGIEVQVLVNLEYKDKKTGAITATSHGDLFSIWGAKCQPDRPHPLGWSRCLPSENRAKGGGEWNHYRVTANDGTIKLAVNDKEVSGVSKCNPRKGYLALESEDAECHFKNLRIHELPSTNPKPEEIAKVAEGHVSLFNGLDMTGWKAEKKSWKAGAGILASTARAPLATTRLFGDAELIFDCKLPAKTNGYFDVQFGEIIVRYFTKLPSPNPITLPEGTNAAYAISGQIEPGTWQRFVLRRAGKSFTSTRNNEPAIKVEVKNNPAEEKPFIVRPIDGLELMNLFVKPGK